MDAREEPIEAGAAAERMDKTTVPEVVEREFRTCANHVKAAFQKIMLEVVAKYTGADDAKQKKAVARARVDEHKKAAWADPLMWVFDARNSEHHDSVNAGISVVEAVKHVVNTVIETGLGQSIVLNDDGLWRISNGGTYRERRERIPAGATSFAVQSVNPPTDHIGNPSLTTTREPFFS